MTLNIKLSYELILWFLLGVWQPWSVVNVCVWNNMTVSKHLILFLLTSPHKLKTTLLLTIMQHILIEPLINSYLMESWAYCVNPRLSSQQEMLLWLHSYPSGQHSETWFLSFLQTQHQGGRPRQQSVPHVLSLGWKVGHCFHWTAKLSARGRMLAE